MDLSKDISKSLQRGEESREKLSNFIVGTVDAASGSRGFSLDINSRNLHCASREMAQHIRAFYALAEDPGSEPSIHMTVYNNL